MISKKLLAAAILSGGVLAGTAHAAAIISATGATINSGGPGFGSITDTINQSGLSATYTSGVTDFATYLASNPLHTSTFGGFEWFSNQGSTSASVTYDLGSVKVIDALALWNEESSGIGLLDLLTSTDGVNFSPLVSGLVPTDHATLDSYPADVFAFGSVSAQYVRFDMSRCPQPNIGSFAACAIGEVAFREGNLAVPTPGGLALLGLGLAALAGVRRKVA